ncbi:hypothetical protein [uncultured Shewanella sp.]|nr:hypothetical protein [uncultured Shewanella sp.]
MIEFSDDSVNRDGHLNILGKIGNGQGFMNIINGNSELIDVRKMFNVVQY